MHTSTVRLWLLAGTAALSLGGMCYPETIGQLDNARFHPNAMQCVPDGYRNAIPFFAAGGAEGDIVVEMISHGCSHANYQKIQSTHPEVATLTPTADGFHVKTGVPGTTDIQLLDDQGQLVDTTLLTVLAIDRYDMQAGDFLVENVPAIVYYSAVSSDESPLFDTGATQTAVSGSLHLLPSAQAACSSVQFVGTLGTGAFTISSGDVRTGATIQVVSRDLIASIKMDAGSVYKDQTVSVVAKPMIADGRPLYGAFCQWSTSDPSVTLHAQNPNPQIVQFTSGNYAEFQVSQHGSFVITCTIGAVSADVRITY